MSEAKQSDSTAELSKPIAYLYHDASTPKDAHPWLHSTMLVLAADRRQGLRGETPLVTMEQAKAMVASEISRLSAALKRANDQAEHFEREWYLRGDELESALPAMREYARKNPKHHFSTDGTEQDPNGAHAWLDRNEKPNT